jgi:ribokinase
MILVIGSINMDLVMRVPRMPQPGETLTGEQFQTISGGKGANQAIACARLRGASDSQNNGNHQVAMIACIGDDAFGHTLRQTLRHDGIDDRYVTTLPGVASGVASILVDANGQNSIVLAGGANDLLTPAHIDAARPLFEQADIVVLQLETPLATIQHAVQLARSLNLTVVLNPAPAPDAMLPETLMHQIDYLIPNEIEARMLSNCAESTSIDSIAKKLRSLGCKNVLITRGEKGVYAALPDGDQIFPSYSANAVDTTAAGDTFIGGFVAALATGKNEIDAIGFGQCAAALSVTRIGAQTSIPYFNEVFLRDK